jgi:hypothetical protein
LFWTDRWITRQSISDITPEVLAAVNTHALKTRKVAAALPWNAWIQDISGALSADGTWSIYLNPSKSLLTAKIYHMAPIRFWRILQIILHDSLRRNGDLTPSQRNLGLLGTSKVPSTTLGYAMGCQTTTLECFVIKIQSPSRTSRRNVPSRSKFGLTSAANSTF